MSPVTRLPTALHVEPSSADMKPDQSDAIANILNSHDAPSLLEGLELVRAFSKIGAQEDRQKVIDLAKRLATIST